jgi:hypothetical protein
MLNLAFAYRKNDDATKYSTIAYVQQTEEQH